MQYTDFNYFKKLDDTLNDLAGLYDLYKSFMNTPFDGYNNKLELENTEEYIEKDKNCLIEILKVCPNQTNLKQFLTSRKTFYTKEWKINQVNATTVCLNLNSQLQNNKNENKNISK